jgi:hypothetical protein
MIPKFSTHALLFVIQLGLRINGGEGERRRRREKEKKGKKNVGWISLGFLEGEATRVCKCQF